jgi:hypothetical protein
MLTRSPAAMEKLVQSRLALAVLWVMFSCVGCVCFTVTWPLVSTAPCGRPKLAGAATSISAARLIGRRAPGISRRGGRAGRARWLDVMAVISGKAPGDASVEQARGL